MQRVRALDTDGRERGVGLTDARCRGGERKERFLGFLVGGGVAGLLRVDEGGFDRLSEWMRGATDVPHASLGGLVWMDWGRGRRRHSEERDTCMRGR